MSINATKISSINEAFQLGRKLLQDLSPSADLDAQLLLAFVLKLTKLQIIMEPDKEIQHDDLEKYLALIERRRKYEPVAYITGSKEFWGMDFEVNQNVLVPRPDTELLVDIALTFSAEFEDPCLICDLGTGSGCIPVALSFELKRRNRNFFIMASDISLEALKIARKNALKNGYLENIGFVCSDWSSATKEQFDLVVSNPPYLMSDDKEVSNELVYEPQSALYAGVDGLDQYREIFKKLPDLLSDKGVFLGEIAYGQAHLLEKLAQEVLPHPKIEFHYDLRRVQRVVEIRLPIPV